MAESRIDIALKNAGIPDIILKPEQVKCFEYILQGYDVIAAVLPTGFGKSLLYQLLPDILPMKTIQNIVIVVCPLTSIIEDQLKVLKDMGINASVFRSKRGEKNDTLFDQRRKGMVEKTTAKRKRH
jgi:superfamily II DNA helicase RecQ